jgi:hypothetical protein
MLQQSDIVSFEIASQTNHPIVGRLWFIPKKGYGPAKWGGESAIIWRIDFRSDDGRLAKRISNPQDFIP